MKKYILFIVFLFPCVFCFSQTDSDTLIKHKCSIGLLGYIGINGSYNNLSNLNQTLSNDTLPGTAKFAAGFNFGADLRIDYALISLNTEIDMSSKQSGNYNISSTGLKDELSFGYYLFNCKTVHIAPVLGIGIYNTRINITQKSGYANFNDVLVNRNSISLNQNAALADFAIRIDFADFTKQTDYLGGVKIGYNYGLSNAGWGIDETTTSTIADSPKDRLGQFYITFYAGKSRKKQKHS